MTIDIEAAKIWLLSNHIKLLNSYDLDNHPIESSILQLYA